MKILHPILCYYPSQAGGPANTLYWLNSHLVDLGIRSTVLSTRFGITSNIASKLEYAEGHKVQFFKGIGVRYIFQAIRDIRRSDVIQFSSLFYPPTLPLLIAALVLQKTVVLSPRGELYPSALKQKAFKKKLWLFIMKKMQSQIHFHATNSYEASIIAKHFPKAKSITEIPNFICLPEIQQKQYSKDFLFLGRINPIKNIHLLIEAFEEVREYKSHQDSLLLIAGEARLPYEKEYLEMLKSQVKALKLEHVVKFLGHVEGVEKDRLLANCRALILPSKSENFGNVVLEALAQKTPVIASKQTPWELLQDYNAGYWVEPKVNAIKNAMIALLKLDIKDYDQCCENAYKLCKTKFDIQTNIKVWEQYYKTINHV